VFIELAVRERKPLVIFDAPLLATFPDVAVPPHLLLAKSRGACMVATRSSPLRRTAAQPPNLPSMIDFMTNDMKPLEVIVHSLTVPK
jgi:hypothetical protein